MARRRRQVRIHFTFLSRSTHKQTPISCRSSDLLSPLVLRRSTFSSLLFFQSPPSTSLSRRRPGVHSASCLPSPLPSSPLHKKQDAVPSRSPRAAPLLPLPLLRWLLPLPSPSLLSPPTSAGPSPDPSSAIPVLRRDRWSRRGDRGSGEGAGEKGCWRGWRERAERERAEGKDAGAVVDVCPFFSLHSSFVVSCGDVLDVAFGRAPAGVVVVVVVVVVLHRDTRVRSTVRLLSPFAEFVSRSSSFFSSLTPNSLNPSPFCGRAPSRKRTRRRRACTPFSRAPLPPLPPSRGARRLPPPLLPPLRRRLLLLRLLLPVAGPAAIRRLWRSPASARASSATR